MAKIHSVPGIFGGEDFYDESGQKVGYTVPGLFGGRDFYNADGQPAGYSVDSVISGENFYDAIIPTAKCFSPTNLRYMKRFYELVFEISEMLPQDGAESGLSSESIPALISSEKLPQVGAELLSIIEQEESWNYGLR